MAADERDRRIGASDDVRSVFDALTLMAACYRGPELEVVAANEAFRALANRDDVVGQPLRALFPELHGQQMLATIERVRRTGRIEVGSEWRLQFQRTPADEVDERYINFVASPHPHDPDSVIAYGLDVTEQVVGRLVQERRAAESERRYEAARDIVDELQQALLPTGLPVLPQLDIAARYLIAAHDQTAGGDWFDAITLPSGAVALVVGDVVGHGVAASAAMGQIRAVLKHALTSTTDVETAVAQVDRFAAGEPSLRATTVAVMVVDPASGRAEYCLCGHPPIVVASTDGTTAFLGHPDSAPLGVGHLHTVSGTVLSAGDVVMLYSDGLIERPGRALAETTAQLAAVAADAVADRVLPAGAAGSPSARVCELTVELLTRGGYDDDVTALAAQFVVDPPPVLSVTTTGDAAGAAGVLTATRAWVSALTIGHESELVIELAVNEAIENVVEHAYLQRPPGPLRVSGELRHDGVAEVVVGDDGIWQPPIGERHGRSWGLALIERLADDVVVVTGTPHPLGSGTVVTLRHRLTRPALIATTPVAQVPAAEPAIYASEEHADDAGITLRVMGAIDAANGDRFAADVSNAARGGTVDLTLDLSAVTLLSSKGVRALYSVRQQSQAARRGLVFLAPHGSPARVVLDLVGLADAAYQ
jgi:serine phosphatase RsbU (regulator of sigma subunit)/anti-anti-sigma regulatory factor/anti-sigma regulatory factor (Ser/Thr protein kinase)